MRDVLRVEGAGAISFKSFSNMSWSGIYFVSGRYDTSPFSNCFFCASSGGIFVRTRIKSEGKKRKNISTNNQNVCSNLFSFFILTALAFSHCLYRLLSFLVFFSAVLSFNVHSYSISFSTIFTSFTSFTDFLFYFIFRCFFF